MRHILFLFLAALIPVSTCAYDFTAQDRNGNTIYYNRLEDGTAEVTHNGSSNTYAGDIAIPDTVFDGELPRLVTAVGQKAFWASTLASLQLPVTIREIKNSAFNSAKLNTEYLYLPQLERLGATAFYGCLYLNRIIMPSLQQIDEGVRTFTDCYDLREVVLPHLLVRTDSLSPLLFDSNILLEGIRMPANLKTVPQGCFRACWNLRYAILPDSAETIGANAFLGCVWLRSITIPAKVKSIGDTFICGTALTWQGGAYTDINRFGGYYLDGLYPGDNASNQLRTVFFEGRTPPQVTSSTFAYVNKANVSCYVPYEALETYMADSLYRNAFAHILGYRPGISMVEEITLHSASLKWHKDSLVTRYQIHLCHAGDTVAHYLVDSTGTLLSSSPHAPHIHRMTMDTTVTTSDYFVLTVDDLQEGTDYNYDVQGSDVNDVPIYHDQGAFRTLGTESMEQVPFSSQIINHPSSIINNNGLLFIQCNNKRYSITGQLLTDE